MSKCNYHDLINRSDFVPPHSYGYYHIRAKNIVSITIHTPLSPMNLLIF